MLHHELPCRLAWLSIVSHGARPNGTVRTQSGPLLLRDYPSLEGRVVARLPSGTAVTVYGRTGQWYSVGHGGQLGYAAAAYIQ